MISPLMSSNKSTRIRIPTPITQEEVQHEDPEQLYHLEIDQPEGVPQQQQESNRL